MLSILIPTYNYDCSQLVTALKAQCDDCGVAYEIIVADDGSSQPVWHELRQKIGGLENCIFIRREQNVGRSQIRNFLASAANGSLFLFMDQDGKVVRGDFIRKYLDAARSHDVVCGGIIHSDETPPPDYSLRYRYEKNYERRLSIDKLNSDVRSKFRSFCFLIKREVAEAVTMDAQFGRYGYEDVKYGIDLRKAGFRIFHIDNPLMNDDIENNPDFVRKTEEALQTLHQFKDKLRGNVTLLDRAEQLKRIRLYPLLRLLSAIVCRPIRQNLCSCHPAVCLFNFYKLLYYISIDND